MANFCKQMSVSLRSGLTLSRAFPVIARESTDMRLRQTTAELSSDIASGSTLADAIRKRAKRFPPILVEMVDAGERTGHLDVVFERLAKYLDMRLRLRRAVIRASVYPAIQLFTAAAVFSLILIVFSSDKNATAVTIAGYAILALALVVATVLFFSRTAVGRTIRDHAVLMTPVVRSVAIKLCMARFTRTLAMQLESAVPVAEAIERSAMVAGNGAVTSNLMRVAEPVRRGASLSEAVRSSSMVTPMVREVLAVGEETGNFPESLERVANIYEEESLLVLESLPKFIGPVVVLLVGLVVIYLFYTVYFVHYLKPLLDIVGM